MADNMDQQQFQQLISSLGSISVSLRESGGFSFDQVVTLVTMCATGIVFLAGSAYAILRRVDDQHAQRDQTRAEERKDMIELFQKQMDEVVEAIRMDRQNVKEEFVADRGAMKAELELLHTRIANIRKEFVIATQYDKDIGRIEASNRAILEGIERAGQSLNLQIQQLSTAVTTLNATQSHHTKSLETVQAQQAALLGLVRPTVTVVPQS